MSVLDKTSLAATAYYSLVGECWRTCVFYQRSSDNPQEFGEPVYPISQAVYEPLVEPRTETITLMAKKNSPIACTSWTDAEKGFTQVGN